MALPDTLISKVQAYKPSDSVKKTMDEAAPIVLVGISGAGKDTILAALRSSDDYHFIISHTTRAPRANNGVMEVDGRDYHFIDAASAEKMLDEHLFIEANVYAGNVYGASVHELSQAQAAKKIPITDIEVQGVADYVKLSQKVRPIFILPPSFQEWLRRLNARGTLSEADLQQRLERAVRELDFALENDIFVFVVNDNLQTAVKEVDAIAHGLHHQADEVAARQLAHTLRTQISERL